MKTRNIVKKALVFMVLAALLVPLFLVRGASAAETKTYDVNGFSLSVPAAWEHQQMDMDMKDLQISGLPKKVENGKFSMHTFMDGTEKGMFAISMDIGEKVSYAKMKKQIKKAFKNGDALKMTGMTEGGKIKITSVNTNLGKGLKISMKVKQNNKEQSVEVYMVTKETKMLVLTGLGVDCSSVLQSVK